ncbi:hypothetical protein BHE74_00004116 [Ensete ventricosum]|nr:hypothetical protein BHE74_00004116 [Ensete ventricosum]
MATKNSPRVRKISSSVRSSTLAGSKSSCGGSPKDLFYEAALLFVRRPQNPKRKRSDRTPTPTTRGEQNAMRKWALPSALLLLLLLSTVPDRGTTISYLICADLVGWKLHANAEDSGDSDELLDPPKVEDKLGAVPYGLSTDSEVAKR